MDGDSSEPKSKLQGATSLNLPLESIPVEFDELVISEEDNAKLISLNDELVKILDIKVLYIYICSCINYDVIMTSYRIHSVLHLRQLICLR